jgi:hypothetical protein
VKARSRLLPQSPGRVKPMGASSGRRVKSPSFARDSWKGRNPEAAACWAGPSRLVETGAPIGETAGGFFRAETLGIPSGRRKLRRVNPTSAAGVKQNRHGIEGRKPSRG